MSADKITIELNEEIVAEINRLRAKIRESLAIWQANAVAMDAVADEENDEDSTLALECRERARTLRDCAKDLADIA